MALTSAVGVNVAVAEADSSGPLSRLVPSDHLIVVEHDPELALASIIPLCDCAGCEEAVQRIAKALEDE